MQPSTLQSTPALLTRDVVKSSALHQHANGCTPSTNPPPQTISSRPISTASSRTSPSSPCPVLPPTSPSVSPHQTRGALKGSLRHHPSLVTPPSSQLPALMPTVETAIRPIYKLPNDGPAASPLASPPETPADGLTDQLPAREPAAPPPTTPASVVAPVRLTLHLPQRLPAWWPPLHLPLRLPPPTTPASVRGRPVRLTLHPPQRLPASPLPLCQPPLTSHRSAHIQ